MCAQMRVLIADDHPGIVKAVSRLLSLDYEIVGTVASVAALLESVHGLSPDVIVLDLHLADADGLIACREITQANPEIKVIVFTAADHPEVRRRALEAGAVDVVHKLASVNDLRSAVKRLESR
jgi:DNA-binding NarL/FixJ family response regulator